MKHVAIVLSIFLIVFNSQAQLGVGTATPNASAQLDVTSTNKGFLAPRMTNAQRVAIVSPATGLLVFQTDEPNGFPKGFYFYNGSAWVAIGATGSTGATGANGKTILNGPLTTKTG